MFFFFPHEIDEFIAEYVAFKMRYATVFNKLNINSTVLSFMILFFLAHSNSTRPSRSVRSAA